MIEEGCVRECINQLKMANTKCFSDVSFSFRVVTLSGLRSHDHPVLTDISGESEPINMEARATALSDFFEYIFADEKARPTLTILKTFNDPIEPIITSTAITLKLIKTLKLSSIFLSAVPRDWKVGWTVTVHRGDTPRAVSYYRRLSLESVSAKPQESITCSPVSTHMSSASSLFHCCTKVLLAAFTHGLDQSLEHNHQMSMILLDFPNASEFY